MSQFADCGAPHAQRAEANEVDEKCIENSENE